MIGAGCNSQRFEYASAHSGPRVPPYMLIVNISLCLSSSSLLHVSICAGIKALEQILQVQARRTQLRC